MPPSTVPPPHRRKAVEADILRSVQTHKVAKEFGSVLRSGSTGNEQTYQLSQPCAEIDVFLSHSWRDSGLLKYLALCLYFNTSMATVAAVLAGLACFYLQACKGFAVPFLPFTRTQVFYHDFLGMLRVMGLELHSSVRDNPARYRWMDFELRLICSPTCQLAAITAFVLVFLFGHRMRPPRSMFLDKVCIHQTDQKKKAAGIAAIDVFIDRSSLCLILYNNDYFERLWCCFELAARASSGREIVMLPLWRAPCFLAITVGFFAGHVAEWAAWYVMGPSPSPSFLLISASFHAMPLVCLMIATIRAVRQRLRLATTLRSFKVANTKCFDPNDRSIVERAIASWFGQDGISDAKAIERFEHDVREGISHGMIWASIGSQPGLLRYSDLVASALVVWWPTVMDLLLEDAMHGTGIQLGDGTTTMFAIIGPPFQMVVPFFTIALAIELVLRAFPSTPAWLIIPPVFALSMMTMIGAGFAVFVIMFSVCGSTCTPF